MQEIITKKIYCVLILLCTFTGYLFSQSKENELIKMDTVVRVDTVVVEEPVADRIVVKESTDDTLVIKKEKIGILIVEGGVIGNRHGSIQNIALSVKIPISDHIHITPKISYVFPLSLMIGQYIPLDKNEKFLIEGSTGVAVWGFGLFFPINASVYYRVSKNALLSFSTDLYLGGDTLILPIFGVSFGLGITY